MNWILEKKKALNEKEHIFLWCSAHSSFEPTGEFHLMHATFSEEDGDSVQIAQEH